eukprot:573615-Pelagomonas_calceolata.AAC.2
MDKVCLKLGMQYHLASVTMQAAPAPHKASASHPYLLMRSWKNQKQAWAVALYPWQTLQPMFTHSCRDAQVWAVACTMYAAFCNLYADASQIFYPLCSRTHAETLKLGL